MLHLENPNPHPSHTIYTHPEVTENLKRTPKLTSFTSFQDILRIVRASFSPHRFQFSRVQKHRDTGRYLIPSLSLRRAPGGEEPRASGKEKWDQRRCCCHKGAVCSTERNLTSGPSRSHSQHSPPKHNSATTTSSVQHITQRDRGNRCFQAAHQSFTGFPSYHRNKMWSGRILWIPSRIMKCTHETKNPTNQSKAMFVLLMHEKVSMLPVCGTCSTAAERRADDGSSMINSFH